MEALCHTPKEQEIMTLNDRIELLVTLGETIDHESNMDIYGSARNNNPWFTIENIKQAIDAIKHSFLSRDKITDWLSNYNVEPATTKTVGLVTAGNIPLVGMHDLMCIFLSGHHAMIKLSDKDTILPTYLIHKMLGLNQEIRNSIQIVDRLENYDAVIATGSDTTGKYFEQYFGKVPHIIRKNRNGVAVIAESDTLESLQNIGHDLFDYFGLGCRNVSKVYLEKNVDEKLIFQSIEDHKEIIHHNKYKNNYDYTYALYLMNKEKFLTDDVLILREHTDIASRIACLHYERFDDRKDIEKELNANKNKIQCVVSSEPVGEFKHFGFGQAQSPAIDDYADGVDTMAFLSKL